MAASKLWVAFMLKDTEKEEKTWNQVPETAKNVSVFFHFFRNYVTERESSLKNGTKTAAVRAYFRRFEAKIRSSAFFSYILAGICVYII